MKTTTVPKFIYSIVLNTVQSISYIKYNMNNTTKSKMLKLLVIMALCVVNTHILSAQSSKVPSEIISAFNSGDVSRLSAYISTNVQLVTDNVNDIYSKQQAVGIISDFFRRNGVLKFELLHQGAKESTSFAVGILHTVQGKFRVNILTRFNANAIAIQQIRIESYNE